MCCRCCESTLQVLRGSGEALLTILTVLLYDPLYAWTISPHKAFLLQADRGPGPDTCRPATPTTPGLPATPPVGTPPGGEPLNKVAERVLLRLRQKLSGQEQGVHLSVSGHVNLLLQEATDPHNLCRLFPGWQPYI